MPRWLLIDLVEFLHWVAPRKRRTIEHVMPGTHEYNRVRIGNETYASIIDAATRRSCGQHRIRSMIKRGEAVFLDEDDQPIPPRFPQLA